MRLLNTETFELQEFTGSNIPKYAILSHRWEGQELTFQDVLTVKLGRDGRPRIDKKNTKFANGWPKIEGACNQAWEDRYQWIWIDSCCIDKTSSAELSEAINSMFVWYRNAEVCYAYLSDVLFDTDERPRWNLNTIKIEMFTGSKWFTRGWTLQELLAPRHLRFFSGAWDELGKREKLWSLVSKTTGIEDWNDFKSATIAEKFSWASRRETTRVEDQAYSLMGLFGVNMPPLYGEGESAFIRLQLEILKTSDDESIFAWEDANDHSGGLLARSPDAFRNSGGIRRFHNTQYEKPPYSMTNKGLQVEFPVLLPSQLHIELLDADDTFLALLHCSPRRSYAMLGILLRRIKGNRYTKVSSPLIVLDWNDNIQNRVEGEYKTVQVKQEDDSDVSFAGLPQYLIAAAAVLSEMGEFETSEGWMTFATWSNIWRGHDTGDGSVHIGRAVVEADGGFTAGIEFANRDTIGENDNNHKTVEGRRDEHAVEGDLENKHEGGDEHPQEELSTSQSDRFAVIFNMYARRARLAVAIPTPKESLEDLLTRLTKPGDWMADVPLQSWARLPSGTMITARLSRQKTDLWLRSYQAILSFSHPQELHSQSMPRVYFELPNNEVTSFGLRLIERGSDETLREETHTTTFMADVPSEQYIIN